MFLLNFLFILLQFKIIVFSKRHFAVHTTKKIGLVEWRKAHFGLTKVPTTFCIAWVKKGNKIAAKV